MHITHAPLRLATGAFILNSGIGKLSADEGTAEFLYGAATGAYPAIKELAPDLGAKNFTKVLAVGEIVLGAALLAPMVPSAVAGTALTGFGSALIGMYLRTPGMTEADGIRPTQEGVPVAKDIWLVGAGVTLAVQGVVGGVRSGAKSVAGGVRSGAGSVSEGVRGALPCRG